jgi:transposase
MPPSRRRIISPYDTEARFSVRRSVKWQGYRVHVTETCDAEQPLLITNVETTTSASLDLEWTDSIRQHLQEKDLLPKDHLVDAGYVDARALAEGRGIYGLDLIGPTKPDPSWQARQGELYGIAGFVINTLNGYDWAVRKVEQYRGNDARFISITDTQVRAFLSSETSLTSKSVIAFLAGLSALWT